LKKEGKVHKLSTSHTPEEVEYGLRYEINANDWFEVPDDRYDLVWRICKKEGGAAAVYIYIF
jgi:hypothetical protein